MKTYQKLFVFFFVIVAFLFSVNRASSQVVGLSETNVYLSVGQTSVVTAYNYGYNNYNSLYISNNSNDNVATATISGNNITIYANNVGNTNITVCRNGNYSCDVIYVNVQGGSSYYSLNSGFKISNLTLPLGSSATITSSSGVGVNVTSNSNPNIVSTSYGSASYSNYSNSNIPGCYTGYQYSVITGAPCYNNYYSNYNYNSTYNGSVVFTAITPGYTNITLCQSNGNVCNTMYVTVTNNYPTNINYIQPATYSAYYPPYSYSYCSPTVPCY